MTSKLARAATPADPALTSAIRVLTLEADSIRALADSLDGAFSAAVDRLERVSTHQTGGRVIVSGMGKSGHVARKIAATLASTGTPAQFVHPAEASHGDLGMITAADAVVCLSNSGETPELNDLVAHAKRFEIPLIAIVGREDSTLAQAADIALILPKTPEACPLGLAPTTSTTMMLALGDALAVALLERKGFTAEDFQVLHPGGKLGKALIKVSDIMHTGDEVPLVPLGTGMREAVLVMTAKTFGCVGIADAAGKLVGIITDGDLRRHIDGDLFAQKVEDVMTHAPKTIRPQALAAEALGRMKANKVTALFVVAEGKVLGILRIHDILRAGVV
ncbi:MAG TPA: KpsF/GutQ family sugar-phosphate isomerase [Alphaproteobacteria bacterium]|nr:KpsF/GutQ family sugar-phosphate isomerase [Alphaproteobacteria bacterium]